MSSKVVVLRPLLAATLALAIAAPASAIVGGTPTTAFGQVSTDVRGNGVQITPNWVLTAHHIDYGASGGTTFSDGYGSSGIAAVFNFTSAAFPTDDISLLLLATPISAAPSLSLLANVLADGSYAPGIDVTIATGHNQSPRGYAATQIVEVGTTIIDHGAPKTVNYLVAATDSPPYVQAGDSGGGLFLGTVTDSVSPLLGITSAMDTDTTVVPNIHYSLFVQIAAYRSWIDQTMAAHSVDGTNFQSANWVSVSGLPSPVPEPGTAALWLGGLLAAAFGARRRA